MKTRFSSLKAVLMFWMLVLIISVPRAISQPVNELPLMGYPNGRAVYLLESGDHYYYAHSVGKNWTRSPYYPSFLMEGHKSDKMSYSLLHTATFAGDTTQYDSFIVGGIRYAPWNGNIAFVANEYYNNPYNSYLGITFSVLDSALNTIIPQRRLKFVAGGGEWEDPHVVFMLPIGERLGIFYSQKDTSGFQRFRTCTILLDRAGNILKDTSVVNYSFLGASVVTYPGNRYMLGGNLGHILLDSNLEVVDTFLHPRSYYRGFFPHFTLDQVSLPSGTIIQGGEYSANLTTSQATGISRLSAATRHAYDTTILFIYGGASESSDDHSYQNLQYNAFDNRIYYVNSIQQSPYPCRDTGSYVQVICTDTMLRTIWRKFITLAPYVCATANWAAASDGRSGVGVMGYHYDIRYDLHDTAHSGSFLFHLDSAGAVSVNGGPAPLVRDRLKIYPNPATDAVVIDDILGGLSGFALYDMSGRLVSSATATGKLAKVSLEELSAGPYILRVLLSDGSAVSQTVIRR